MLRAVGIVCEYNPFHNGHLYQIQKIKEEYPDKAIVCAMSGNYVERGDIAMFDKYLRADAAIRNGADLVLEIPFPYSIFSAEGYAIAGVEILSAFQAVDTLAFGCEQDDIKSLCKTADNLCDIRFEELLAENLKKERQHSYACARIRAYNQLFGESLIDMTKPNNILAIEYLKAVKRGRFDIKPFAVKRIGSNHDDCNSPDSSAASASYIRNNYPKSACFLPENTQKLIENAPKMSINRLFSALKSSLILSYGVENVYCFDELFSSAKKSINDAFSFDELVGRLTTKKYTRAFVRRGLISYLLNVPKGLFKSKPDFTIVLAADKKGRELLRQSSKDECKISVITKPSQLNEITSPSAQLEINADRLATVCMDRDTSADFFLKAGPVIEDLDRE